MTLENEIKQLERSINTLVRRPTLIRHDYWTVETEKLLLRRELSMKDRHRLTALLNLLSGIIETAAPECPPSALRQVDRIECKTCDLRGGSRTGATS